ncbi:alpha/beta fold hydrolase [Streptomyces sp. H10-C2]|uniref:alpha/beta fold hydrolase n=1 Tax=unclassified Streptomyces TaxID=2593676 RepID=UPI0024BBA404|nr:MULTISPECIES: alpha/beta fold hydrolase [unclassified Streptomyces]MDJ0343131.1 alpha/beta fold hydrolase [Streptomyces sp. PH10-H1]MDJ0371073.1 alpha/beta fold hydrolase [Streptomyces sp. H10-C2]
MRKKVQAADGRQLAVESVGDPRGRPVFLLHGTPGSRLGPAPRGMVLYQQRVRLITYDRPGYGSSDRLTGRRVADVAQDVESIADALGIERFSVVGRSGGGPHALACAALLPHRVTKAAALVGLAPWGADGLDWFAGMAASNVREYTTAAAGRDGLAASLVPRSDAIRADPRQLLAQLRWELTESDRRVVNDSGIRSMLVRNYREALRHSADGWIDDALSFCSPWGFDPADIAVPVLLWHGEDDVFSPVGHSRWLAERIPGVTTILQPAAAHFAALRVLPDILTWLLSETTRPMRAG